MSPLAHDPVFFAYVVTALALVGNLLLLANNTALTRAFAREVVNPEDKRESAPLVVGEGGNERTARYRRAHRNALENIPMFLVTALLLPVVHVPLAIVVPLFAVFVVARWLHTYCYLKSLAPWRTVMFAIGALDQIAVLGVLGVYAWLALG